MAEDDVDDPNGVHAALAAMLARDPQPGYRALRRHGPIVRVEGAGVLVTHREDVDDVLRDPAAFSSGMAAVDLKNVRPLIPLQIDPPRHKDFRRILDPLFAPARMNRLEGPVTELVHRLIDGFEGEDEIDFTRQFSVPFPSQVFLTLLGLPLDELPRFLEMKDGIIRPAQVLGKGPQDPEVQAYQARIAASIYDYFEGVLDERERERRDDLLSRFLDTEVDGRRLSREDILDVCFLFLIAGLDTVSASLDCFFGRLAEHPGERRQVVADPTLVPAVVEELLRWETPVAMIVRVATGDTEVAGCPVAAGEHVVTVLGSADTDDTDLPDADVVRWDREINRHLAFGGGIHRCLGSHLARLELRVALREWHARIPDYRVAPGAALAYTPGIRSLDTFPMQLGVSA